MKNWHFVEVAVAFKNHGLGPNIFQTLSASASNLLSSERSWCNTLPSSHFQTSTNLILAIPKHGMLQSAASKLSASLAIFGRSSQGVEERVERTWPTHCEASINKCSGLLRFVLLHPSQYRFATERQWKLMSLTASHDFIKLYNSGSTCLLCDITNASYTPYEYDTKPSVLFFHMKLRDCVLQLVPFLRDIKLCFYPLDDFLLLDKYLDHFLWQVISQYIHFFQDAFNIF